MKKLLVALFVLAGAFQLCAETWKGLVEENWYSGPKLTEKDLVGKVVLVDKWGVRCPPCRALLPKMQKLYDSLKKRKNFVFIASHCQGRNNEAVAKLVKENNLTFPIYENVGLAANEPTSRYIPFMYVVDARGNVVYSGNNYEKVMIALAKAFVGEKGFQSLVPMLSLDDKNPYAPLIKQAVIGRPIAPIIKRLEAEVKKAEKASAPQAVKDKAAMATQILEAIEEGKKAVRSEIDAKMLENPFEAISLANLYVKSFPTEKDAIRLKEKIPELKKAARAWYAEQKAKRAAEKAAEKNKDK